MSVLLPRLITNFFIALDVLLGGISVGGLGSFLFSADPPFHTVSELAQKMKIWALITAPSGSFPTFKAIEIGFLTGQPAELSKQVAMVLSAFAGSRAGFLPLKYLLEKLEIKMEENDFVEPVLKEERDNLASGVLGHEIRALPYPMVINLLENREVEAEGKAYRLDVEAVIIGETLTCCLKAEK